MINLPHPYGQRVSSPHVPTGDDMAKQSMKDDCDINVIISRFNRTGVLPRPNALRAQYADVSQVTDYHDALEIVRRAEEEFDSLPASVRKVFENDPAIFLDAVHDADKRHLLEQAGLVDPVPAPNPPREPEAPTGGDGE